MPRMVLTLAAFMLGLAVLPAASQQLQQPRPRPVATPPDALPASPTDRRPAPLPSDPGQRPPSASPVPSEGPAKLLPPTPPATPRVEPEDSASPTGVFDASGRPLNRLRRVAPNRAFDPRTGRFYETTPAGKLVQAPPASPPPPDR